MEYISEKILKGIHLHVLDEQLKVIAPSNIHFGLKCNSLEIFCLHFLQGSWPFQKLAFKPNMRTGKFTCFSICWPSLVNTWMRMRRMWMWLGMSRRARLETMWKMSLLMPSVR